ncbi:MAG: hypothetical protein HQ517_02785, partial [SAR324 cluster bacterium]|nr:hypothetical protein [SAR324 cluster bacterium]
MNPSQDPHFYQSQVDKYQMLVERGMLKEEELHSAIEGCDGQHVFVEDRLLLSQIHREEILECLAEYYGVPVLEYGEEIVISPDIVSRVNLEDLKKSHWVPVSVEGEVAHVIAYQPQDLSVIQ